MEKTIFNEEWGLCELKEIKLGAILFPRVLLHADMSDNRYQEMMGSRGEAEQFLPLAYRGQNTFRICYASSEHLKENVRYRDTPDPYRASLLEFVKNERARGRRLVPLADWDFLSIATDLEPADFGYSACLEAIPIPDISAIPWTQVQDFRLDAEANRGLRSLRNWLREGLTATSHDHAIDVIGSKVDAYHAAIKKHGLATRLGIYQYLLDWKNITAIVAGAGLSSAAGVPILGLVGTGAFILGNVAARILEHRVVAQDDLAHDHEPMEFLLNLDSRFDSSITRTRDSKVFFGHGTAGLTTKEVHRLIHG